MTSRLVLLSIAALHLPLEAANLRFLAWNDEVASRAFNLAHGRERTEVGYLHPSARSAPFEVPEDSPNLRLELSGQTDAEGQPAAIPLKLRDGIDEALVILLPDPKAPTGVRTLILDDSIANFSWGTIRLLNATPKELAFRWDKQAKRVPSGWKPTDISPGGNDRNMEVFLYLTDDLKNPLYSAVWEQREDTRQLVFLVPSTNSSLGPVEFKIIPELRVENEKEAP